MKPHMEYVHTQPVYRDVETLTTCQTNRLVTNLAPWKIAKKLSAMESEHDIEQQQAELAGVIYILAEWLRVLGILLQPFMPGKAAEMLDSLGVSVEKRTFEYAAFGKDFSYGKPLIDLGRDVYGGLFPQLDVED